jgi:hypothetical protein
LGTALLGVRPARSWDCLSSERKLSARGLNPGWKCKREHGDRGLMVPKMTSCVKAAELADHLTRGVADSRVPESRAERGWWDS